MNRITPRKSHEDDKTCQGLEEVYSRNVGLFVISLFVGETQRGFAGGAVREQQSQVPLRCRPERLGEGV